MMTNKKHDVIIVGAGPVGSYTAYLLANQGLDVVIFEKNSAVGQNVNCTGIVSGECIQRFQIPPDIVDKPIHTIKAFAPSGESVQYTSHSPFAFAVNRTRFDQEFNRLARNKGVITYLDSAVRKVSTGEECFNVHVQYADGTKEIFQSSAGVLATGFELNALTGIAARHVDFHFGIQADVAMHNLNDVEVYFGKKIVPESFAWVVPVNGKTAKVGLIAKKKPAQYLKKFIEIPQISERLASKDYMTKCSPLPMRRIQKSYGERFLIVGEAAGQVKTTTGGGIYFGLICAEIAVDIIAHAFSCGDFSESIFRKYETAWSETLDPELKAGNLLRSFFGRLSDRQINLLIKLTRTDGILPIIQSSNFDWHKDIISHLIRNLIRKRIFQFT